MLDDRKLRILEALISDYIATGEPVGSRTISKRYISSISSATIRNEMADLEDLGYLEKPHTSAGRIPSDKAYRFYVDHLLKAKELNTQEINIVHDNLETDSTGIEDVIARVSKLLSTITKYTTVVAAPRVTVSTIQGVHVIKVNLKSLIVILVFNTGVVKNLIASVNNALTDEYINRLGYVLNNYVKGMEASVILKKFNDAPEVIEGIPKSEVKSIIDVIVKTLNSMDTSDFYLSGTTNIFNFPEFNELSIAKVILDTLVEKDVMSEIVAQLYADRDNVIIGKENNYEQFQKCSIITSSYSINDKVVGTISVIGPTRMEYEKVMAWLDFVSKYMTDLLDTLYK